MNQWIKTHDKIFHKNVFGTHYILFSTHFEMQKVKYKKHINIRCVEFFSNRIQIAYLHKL